MTPILKGTASRLGLRKPTGAYRYKDGSQVIRDEVQRVKEFAEHLGIHLQSWQLDWLGKNVGQSSR